MRNNQLRDQLAILQLALDFAEAGGDPRSFIVQRISKRDRSPWVGAWRPLDHPGFQAEVKALLRALVDRSELEVPVSLRFEVKGQGKAVVVTQGARALRDLFLYRLIRLLEDVGIERVQDASADCDRLFLKVTRRNSALQMSGSREHAQSARARTKTATGPINTKGS